MLQTADVPGPGNPRAHWRFAGATSSANTFQGDRQSPPNLPSVSLFRNRVYDQKSGRWTQEDPISIAGGINLYQFNGNNPVLHTDPFGLQVLERILQLVSRIGPALQTGSRWAAARGQQAWNWVSGLVQSSSSARATIPLLTQGKGHEMLGQAIGHLRDMTASGRVEAFRTFAQQITASTQGSWSAGEAIARNATIFAGKAGEALVFDKAGNMFRGNIANSAAFVVEKGGEIIVHFDKLTPLH